MRLEVNPLLLMGFSVFRRALSTLITGPEAIVLAASPGCRVLDCSWYLGDSPRSHKEFAEERIPMSQHFDIETVKDASSTLPHMLPSATQFAEQVAAMGITNEDHLLLYARKGCFSAPRVWWMFRAFGHGRERLSILDGGLEEWRRCGGTLETGPPSVPAAGSYKCTLNPSVVRSLEEMKAVVDSGLVQVVDSRPALRFQGAAPEPRAGLEAGHMPGAVNVPFTSLVDSENFSRMRSRQEMMAALNAAGVDPGRECVFTCGSGVSAAVLSLSFELLGAAGKSSVYDGSWAEWGSLEELPKVRDGTGNPAPSS
jgi:thiosulfate/3-mercaptopyruvate sulfurtransferase